MPRDYPEGHLVETSEHMVKALYRKKQSFQIEGSSITIYNRLEILSTNIYNHLNPLLSWSHNNDTFLQDMKLFFINNFERLQTTNDHIIPSINQIISSINQSSTAS
jgi:hypothetical protein